MSRERRIDYVEFASSDPAASRAFSKRRSAGHSSTTAATTRLSTMAACRAASSVASRSGPTTAVHRCWCCMPTIWLRSRPPCATPAARSYARCFPSPVAAASSSSSPVATNWRSGPNAIRPERRPTRNIEVAHALCAWRRVRRQRFQGLAEPGRGWSQRAGQPRAGPVIGGGCAAAGGLRRPHRCRCARPVPVVHFDTDVVRDPRARMLGTTTRLPRSIAVRWCVPVADDFHARFSARARRYRYRLLNREVRPALDRQTLSWERRALDETLMHAAGRPCSARTISARSVRCSAGRCMPGVSCSHCRSAAGAK